MEIVTTAKAVFPVAVTNGKSDLVTLTVERGNEDNPSFNKDMTGVDGRSWTLAHALAKRALDPLVPDTTRRALAEDWIVTGVANADDTVVGSVVIGNKLDAVSRPKRKWLYPTVNKAEFDSANAAWSDRHGGRHLPSAHVSTVEAAFRTIAGFGTLPESQQGWPSGIAELHISVGGSINASVVSVLIEAPAKVVLWYSEQSADKARQIKTCVEKKISVPPMFEYLPLNMHDLTGAEEQLRRRLANAPDGTLFNITSGNRIVAMAANTLAQEEKGLRLIYRDFDNKDCDFIQMWYEGGSRRSCLLTPAHLDESHRAELTAHLGMKG
jgi:hypothetical protein